MQPTVFRGRRHHFLFAAEVVIDGIIPMDPIHVDHRSKNIISCPSSSSFWTKDSDLSFVLLLNLHPLRMEYPRGDISPTSEADPIAGSRMPVTARSKLAAISVAEVRIDPRCFIRGRLNRRSIQSTINRRSLPWYRALSVRRKQKQTISLLSSREFG